MSKLTPARIEKLIYVIRNEKVMLDADLASLYDVELKRLNEQVKRNTERFPKDFMFQLTKSEYEALRSQFATFKESTKRRKYLPYVFTEQGVSMLSSVLNSKSAVKVNISIIRTFVKLRKLLASEEAISDKVLNLEKGVNQVFKIVFERLENLEADVNVLEKKSPSLSNSRKKIGLKSKK